MSPLRRRPPIPAGQPPGLPVAAVLLLALVPLLAAPSVSRADERPQPLGPATAAPGPRLSLPVTRPTNWRPSEVMLRAMASFDRLREGGLIDPSVTLTALIDRRQIRLDPLRTDALGPDLAGNLTRGFRLAMQQVQRRPECAALYESRGANGAVLLATTVYLMPSGRQAPALCLEGVAAYTTLERPVTFLCPAFAGLPRTLAATILLHEALHYAGMSEQPRDPNGLTPYQINALVSSACGF